MAAHLIVAHIYQIQRHQYKIKLSVITLSHVCYQPQNHQLSTDLPKSTSHQVTTVLDGSHKTTIPKLGTTATAGQGSIIPALALIIIVDQVLQKQTVVLIEKARTLDRTQTTL